MDHHTKEHLHETPWVVTGPLIALAIPSVVIGWLTIGPVLFGGYFLWRSNRQEKAGAMLAEPQLSERE